ncbi:hypothetical protein BO85DRAFT_521044 [Aspergillus piperis CBS 112811]|uniref:Carboxylesterase type B domain-containing protein n=1 Tax=Aspergillus piperis CBS 112811 TaxID=1448313 RepID=A0A8G1R1Z5_9EURO|nr:hypothetical protein BO85DRAFT_521044 [Aspergillus piperis CBS 112811]RAH56325.1 hypothetical protein BO85DRAFT_521044 [Aspergillus piperis CBS 112811]
MQSYWANFIKNGNPNGEELTYWPPSKEDATTMWLGDSWGAGKAAEPTRIDLIRSWFSQNVEWCLGWVGLWDIICPMAIADFAYA